MRIKATYLRQPVQLITLDNRVVWVRQDDEVDVRDSPHTRALLARGEVAEVEAVFEPEPEIEPIATRAELTEANHAAAAWSAAATGSTPAGGTVTGRHVDVQPLVVGDDVDASESEPAPDLDLAIAWSEAAVPPDPVEPPEYAATEAELAALNAAAHTAPPTEPEYLTMVEAAERLGKSTSTLRRWAARGYGPQPVTVDGAVRYQAGSILAFQAKLRYHGDDE